MGKRLVAVLLVLLGAASVAWALATQRVTIHQIFANGITVRPNTSTDLGVHTVLIVYGGELAENSTIYFGPVPFTTPQPEIDATAFDAQTSATEATADAPAFINGRSRPMHMHCLTNATLGSGESIVATLRVNTVDMQAAQADFACTIGEAATTCTELDNGATTIAANTPTAVQAVMSSNNADADDLVCLVWYQVY